jgi:hypothetical protein
MRSHEDKVKTVVDLLNAIFYGDAGHERLQWGWE